MKKFNLIPVKALIACFIFVAIFISSCEEYVTPTKSSMEGVWTVTHVYDEASVDHASKLNFPITAFSLSSDNTVVSTSAPLTMFIVYGDNKYTQIASDVDQVFNYAGLDFNGGEFFVEDGVVDRFTLEMKLQGLPGQHTLDYLLELLQIPAQWLDVVVYHKFINVGVNFSEDYKSMTWTFDDQTTALYNTKDGQGNYILWNGWPVANFTHCTVVLEKQAGDLTQVVTDAL